MRVLDTIEVPRSSFSILEAYHNQEKAKCPIVVRPRIEACTVIVIVTDSDADAVDFGI